MTLHWIFDELARRDFELPAAPLVLMSYLNPLLAYGYHRARRARGQVGVSGFIMPDLPFEESATFARRWTRTASRSCRW